MEAAMKQIENQLKMKKDQIQQLELKIVSLRGEESELQKTLEILKNLNPANQQETPKTSKSEEVVYKPKPTWTEIAE